MRKVSMARIVWIWVGVTMVLLSMTACPFPVQYEEEPDPGNQPPVVDPTRTDPYVSCAWCDAVQELSRPYFKVYVDDPDPADYLEVLVVKDLDLSWEPDSTVTHRILLEGIISVHDIPDPINEPTVRMKEFEIQTPCPTGSDGKTVFVWVCVTDRVFAETDGIGNPCVSSNGYVATYPVVLHCSSAAD